MYKRLLKSPLLGEKSFFLLGPRGTGKTHWLKNNLVDAVYLDLLDSTLYHELMANPGHLASYIPLTSKGKWVVIDEVQRIPQLLNEVHRFIEEGRCRFALTGSSVRKLRRGGYNLLAGRAHVYTMHPFVMQELKEDFSLEKAIAYGLLPSVMTEKKPLKYLKSYIETYIKEEVAQEGLIRNVGNFYRFLEVASFSQGQILNKANVARESMTKERTVSNYFSILEDLLLGYTVPSFTKKAKRATVKHPKFYFFDVGVYQAIRPKGPLDTPSDIGGISLETLCFQSLMAINDLYELGYDLFYYRTIAGVEVDFILYGDKGIKAIEVKRSKTLSGRDIRGLKSFKQDYPMASCHMVYAGNTKYADHIKVWNVNDFLRQLPEILASTKEYES